MNDIMVKALIKIQNKATTYEMVLQYGDVSVLLGYAPRSFRYLRAALRDNIEEVIKKAPDGADRDFVGTGKNRHIVILDGEDVIMKIKFSGRTHRDAICNGELEEIGRR